ncbi:MAG: hypothetical protein ACJ713_17915 [Candidatus Sulfotelmatobacter sp.]
MDIDQGKFRALNMRLAHMQHALRLVPRKIERLGSGRPLRLGVCPGRKER